MSACTDVSKRAKRNYKPYKKIMKTEILFKLKIKGVFNGNGFIINESGHEMTLTKFVDGTLMLKHGRITIKDRFSSSKRLTDMVLNSI